MGNFLDTPVTKKETHSGSGNGLVFGVSSMQGWRTHMEDAHWNATSMDGGDVDLSSCSVFSVYDGHGGTLAAQYAAENMSTALKATPDLLSINSPAKIGEALKSAFFYIDDALRKVDTVERGEDQSGCTALASIVTPTHIIIANAGDSRAILSKGQKIIPLSFDHKPMNTVEAARIENAGGCVRNRRVNGDLAVSRALGDFVYKNRCDLQSHEQQVSAEPNIEVVTREGSEEFMLLACDGIWDVMSNEDAGKFIQSQMNSGERDMSLIAEELLDRCLELGSRDNMSAVVVAFAGARYQDGPGVKGLRERRERERANQATISTNDQAPPS